MTFPTNSPDDEYIEHFGILGMKWGVRRFQNKDGSLKPAGKKRYNKSNDDDEQRDTGLAPGVQKSNNGNKGLGKVMAAAGVAALAGASVAPTLEALGRKPKDYKTMTDEDLIKENRRSKLEENYKKNNGIKDSPADALESGGKMIEGIQKFRNAGATPYNPNQNRYNTRRTMSQKEMDAMSDKELQQLVNRLNLETQYSRLTSDPPTKSKVDVGLERTQAVLGIVGSAVTIGAAGYGIYSRLKAGNASPVNVTAFEKALNK